MLRILHWCTDQSVTNALETMDLTAAQGHIMGYLAHQSQPPCPRDIEKEFQLSHPTVSGLLSRLEKKGFIEFFPDEHDRRCKRIRLLPRGAECMNTMHHTIDAAEAQMVQGFTDEEKKLFLELLTRAIQNMGGDPWGRRHKEESDS